MKKLTALLCVLCLVGCSSEEDTKTTVCTAEINGVNITNSFKSNGDEITSQSIQNELDYSSSEISAEEITATAEAYKAAYDITGVEYSYENDGSTLFENITIDFTKTDFSELIDAGLITSDSGEEVTYISLEQTLEALENSGFECK